MQLSTQLVSAGLMGVVLIAIVAAVLNVRDWRHVDVLGDSSSTRGERAYGALSAGVQSQLVWVLGFLLLVVGLATAVVVFLEGGPMSAMAGVVVVGVAALVLLAFLGVGLYRTVRFRGRSSASAAAVTAWTFATLFLVAITVHLLLA